jgi:tetratricopeptide (TPR) repeat protein
MIQFSSPAVAVVRPKRTRRPLAAVLLLLGVLALCGGRWAATAVARRRVLVDLASGPYRSLAARLSDPRLDRHRPMRADRARGGGPPVSPLPLGLLSTLERAGDEHGVALSLLLSGEVAQARVRLDRLATAEPRPQVLNDQAAAALAAGDAAAALSAIDEALDRDSLNPQALFNRALALSSLDLPLTAARFFDRVAALGEPGWAAEAAGEATRLRGAYQGRGPGAAGSKATGRAAGEKWSGILADQRRADAEFRLRHYEESARISQDALDRCRALAVDIVCNRLERQLVLALGALYRITEALGHLRAALVEARHQRWIDQQADLLELAGELESLSMRPSLARAYFEELLLNPRARCAERGNGAETAAWLALKQHRVWEAANFINLSPDCGGGDPILTTNGVLTAATLRRMGGAGLLESRVTDSLRLIERSNERAGRYLYLLARGLWLLPEQPVLARQLLDAALEDTSGLPAEHVERRYVERRTHLALAFEAARAMDWRTSLAELAASPGVALPDQHDDGACVLGVASDVDRSLAITRDAAGTVLGTYRAQPIDEIEPLRDAQEPPPVLPASLRRALASCREVKVVAPDSQRAWTAIGLPDTVPWVYTVRRAGPRPPAAADGSGERLIVANPEPPPALRLPPLAPTAVDEGASTRVLRGREANPARVLAELPRADFVEFRVHGVADPNLSEFTALMLSPDRDGRYMLTAREVGSLSLPRHPIVVLAACGAAARATQRPDASELAGAFVRAGARGVIAAMTSIPDAEADAFFATVRARMAGGRSVAVALNEARSAWPEANRSWVSGVVVFE